VIDWHGNRIGGVMLQCDRADRSMTMALAKSVCMVTLLGIYGCARPVTNTTTPIAATVRPVPSSEGTILSLRAITMRSERDPWRVALLADASGAATAADDGNSRLTEFIIRIDSGSTISVVQTNELGFRPGDRVVVLHDGHAHIARPG
jgi:outer membrane lipoprotein SlyB